MRRATLLFVVLVAACSTSDYDRPQPDRARQQRPAPIPMLLDLVPNDDWWRDPQLASPLNLSPDQYQSLTRIGTDQRDEIARLERDLPIAERDLRTAIDADPASQADITTAAQRVRTIRDSLFDRQVGMLAAERIVLTKQQWSQLLDTLQQRAREERAARGNDRGNYPGGRGRGGYPRGGRGRPW